MPDLKHRQKKIQEKRKKTPWREFIMEIGSRVGMTYYRDHGNIRVYPVSDRMRNIVSAEQFAKERDNLPFIEYHSDQGFFEQYLSLQQQVPFPALNHVGNTENVKFAEGIINSKNVYLTNTVVSNCENILYGLNIKDNCRNVISSVNVYNNCDNIFDSYNITNSSNIFLFKIYL